VLNNRRGASGKAFTNKVWERENIPKKRLKSAMITDDSLDNFFASAWVSLLEEWWVAAKLLPTLHLTHATLATLAFRLGQYVRL